jgi:hypothetical protein
MQVRLASVSGPNELSWTPPFTKRNYQDVILKMPCRSDLAHKRQNGEISCWLATSLWISRPSKREGYLVILTLSQKLNSFLSTPWGNHAL